MGRHIDFEGIENFRDFGGYGGACGRALKQGLLYRSANHSYATDLDLERMRALGLAAIIDLRRPDERAREPSRRWAGCEAQVIESDILSVHPDWSRTLQGVQPDARRFHEDGRRYYERAPHEPRHIDLYRRYFRVLAEAPGAIVVHCAAGKDRTGLICALTHHVAGVHPDDILADYLLTNDEGRIARKIAALDTWLREHAGKTVAEDALRVAASVHPDYLEAAFGAVRETHGSVDGYLAEVLGVDADLRSRLRERLLA